ncbi:DNA-binding protein [Variovorax sp. J31P207]|nr:DNA-binding protein [Variovorax sp. J31P207]MDM0071772.1 DNA-binding protein [Variovorax sp. J31P207]
MQLEEVVEAADALLGRGLKPTIERVRQHLDGVPLLQVEI